MASTDRVASGGIGPLAGLRVIEMADCGGEAAGRLLADLGAEVLYVEPPGGADLRRTSPVETPAEAYAAIYFANKRSLAVDAGAPDGEATVLELLAGADIFISDARVRSTALAPEAVAERFPLRPDLTQVLFILLRATSALRRSMARDTPSSAGCWLAAPLPVRCFSVIVSPSPALAPGTELPIANSSLGQRRRGRPGMRRTIGPARAAMRAAHGMLLAFPVALSCGAVLTDVAYLRTAELQWTNFSAWLITICVVFGGLALVVALVGLLLARSGARLLHAGALAVVCGLGLINAFKHSQDGWSSVGAFGLSLSVLTAVAALVAGATAYSGLMDEEGA